MPCNPFFVDVSLLSEQKKINFPFEPRQSTKAKLHRLTLSLRWELIGTNSAALTFAFFVLVVCLRK